MRLLRFFSAVAPGWPCQWIIQRLFSTKMNLRKEKKRKEKKRKEKKRKEKKRKENVLEAFPGWEWEKKVALFGQGISHWAVRASAYA